MILTRKAAKQHLDVVTCVSMILCDMWFVGLNLANSSDARELSWKPVKDRQLRNDEAHTVESTLVTSSIQCAQKCSTSDRCVSTNLSPKTRDGAARTCELLDGTRLHGVELVEAEGWTHTSR